MSPNINDALTSRDGEELYGFGEIDANLISESIGPIKPTTRCKRCGCWLCAERKHEPSENNEEQPDKREYCFACERHMIKYAKPCGFCGETFFSDDKDAIRCPECEAEYQENKKTCAVCGAEFLPHVCVACKDKRSIEDVCHSCHWQKVHAETAERYERICRVCGCSFLPRTCIVPECKKRLTDICSACHEEIEHMGMTATVWILSDCPKCEAVVAELERRHRKVMRLDIEKLAKGDEPDLDAMAQFAISGGAAPLVFIDGRFLEPEEIDVLATGKGNS